MTESSQQKQAIWQAGLGAAVLTLACLVFGSFHAIVFASLPGNIQNYPPVKSLVVDDEDNCKHGPVGLDYQNSAHRSDPPRTRVDNSQPYAEDYWITPLGNPATDVSAGYEDPSGIPLQLNDMQFLCAIIVHNNSGSSSLTDGSSYLNSGNYPNNRAPNAESVPIDGASRFQMRTQIQGATVSGNPSNSPTDGNGYLTGVDVNRVLLASRDSSRYWLSSAVEAFTYHPPTGGFDTNTTVTINFSVKKVYTYHAEYGDGGAVSTCTSGTTGDSITLSNGGSIDYGRCAETNVRVRFTIYVHAPRLTISGRGACSPGVLTGSAVDSDDPSKQLRITAYEDGTSSGDAFKVTSTSGSGHTYSVDLTGLSGSNSIAWRQHRFYVKADGVNSSGNSSGPDTTQPITVGPCATDTCTGSDSTFGVGAVNQTIFFNLWFTTNSAAATPLPDNNFTVQIIYDPGGANTSVLGPQNVPVKFYTNTNKIETFVDDGSGNNQGVSFKPTRAGAYKVTWAYNDKEPDGSTNSTQTCSNSDKAGYNPFFSVQGGDISAGNAFSWNNACNTNDSGNDSATIRSWNANDGSLTGAGSTHGALATGDITNFVSGLGLSPSDSGRVTGYGLSFASSVNHSGTVSDHGYGGEFSSGNPVPNSLPCIHDYQADKANDPTPPTNLGTNISSSDMMTRLTGGAYSLSSSADPAEMTIGSGTDAANDIHIPADGRQVTIYARGYVYITSNIYYQDQGPNGSLTKIPNFKLVVEGSIYIAPDVTNLEGVYIAQKYSAASASGGYIVTCAPSNGVESRDYDTCDHKPLTFTGAVAAEQQIRLDRTLGSFYAAPGTSVTPAETFNYTPELWINNKQGAALNVEAYTSLPPIL